MLLLSKTNIQSFLSLIFFLLMGTSCKQEIDKQTYFKWMTNKESGLYQQVNLGSYFYEVQYKPAITDSILMNEVPILMNEKLFLDSSQQYLIKISAKIKGKTLITDTLKGQSYQQRLDYFNYQFAKDIVLVQDNKTYKPAIFHAEQMSTITGSSTFIVVFDVVLPKIASRYLKIYSPNYLGKDTVKVKFNPLLVPKL
jgi:hypothetical protein